MQNYQQIRHALGSEACLTLACATEAEANEIFQDLWARIDAFEAMFSRFRSSSELTQVNLQAGQVTSVSPPFVATMRLVLAAAAGSDRLYNPLILPALQRAGYKGSWPQPEVADPALVFENRVVAPASDIVLTNTSIRLPTATALDLGGSGKGILLDRLADAVTGKVHGYWFSLGGDIINGGHDAEDQAWRVDVADARKPSEVIAHGPAGDGERVAVTTSGVIKRRGVSAGASWHHIIDPRTLRPAETDLLTVTVRGESALSAEVWAKCAIILGSVEAPNFLKARGVNYALLQTAPPADPQLIEISS